jgi:hypothetical protein
MLWGVERDRAKMLGRAGSAGRSCGDRGSGAVYEGVENLPQIGQPQPRLAATTAASRSAPRPLYHRRRMNGCPGGPAVAGAASLGTPVGIGMLNPLLGEVIVITELVVALTVIATLSPWPWPRRGSAPSQRSCAARYSRGRSYPHPGSPADIAAAPSGVAVVQPVTALDGRASFGPSSARARTKAGNPQWPPPGGARAVFCSALAYTVEEGSQVSGSARCRGGQFWRPSGSRAAYRVGEQVKVSRRPQRRTHGECADLGDLRVRRSGIR